MNIIGTCCFSTRYNGTEADITALMAANTKDILVSWHDLLELNGELKAQLRSIIEGTSTSKLTSKECEQVYYLARTY